MKKVVTFTSIVALLFTLNSCKKSSPTTKTSKTEYFEITIDGKSYKETFPAGIVQLSGFDRNTCDNKPGFLNTIYDPSLNSRFSINSDIQHYRNEVDFDSKGVGNYELNGDTPLGLCHLTLYLSLEDKSLSNENTTLQSGATHTVKSINTISTSTGSKQVFIEGEFSGVYRNSANSNIPVSGKYGKIVEVLK